MVHLQLAPVALTSHDQFLTRDPSRSQKEKVLQAERVLLHPSGLIPTSCPYKPLPQFGKARKSIGAGAGKTKHDLTQVCWMPKMMSRDDFSFWPSTSQGACPICQTLNCTKTSKSLELQHALQYPAQDIAASSVSWYGLQCQWSFLRAPRFSF